jgi:hypothetical protein
MRNDGLKVEPALWEGVVVSDANIYDYWLQHVKINVRMLRIY